MFAVAGPAEHPDLGRLMFDADSDPTLLAVLSGSQTSGSGPPARSAAAMTAYREAKSRRLWAFPTPAVRRCAYAAASVAKDPRAPTGLMEVG
jgi:hypothetical protein